MQLARFTLLLCCGLFSLTARGEVLPVYCDDWPGFCHQDGGGLYLDLARHIYQPLGYRIRPQIMPYKRALAMVTKGGQGMTMGVYLHEVEGVRWPHYPDGADDVTVFMLDKWRAGWQGEQSLAQQRVLWQRGWAFDKYIGVPMRWYEVNSHQDAMSLLQKERYRYYLSAGVLHTDERLPPGLNRVFLRWLPTYPIFASDAAGLKLQQQWDQGMARLIHSGELTRLYRENGLLDYYRDFLRGLRHKGEGQSAR
ncbi:substrate-binding periplasmic protein [Aeromonas bivalvium]|uniref:Substrate-binding periplasmic protein n=1 Tax=Aeromonas bivalvium TaxID=440079 RepID=A0ABW9GSV8_9GAMM